MGLPLPDIGLLVIRGSNELIRKKIRRLLELAVTKVQRKLYVHVEQREGFKELLPTIYLNAAILQSEIDLRVLMDKQTISVDRIFYDEVKDPDHPSFPMLTENQPSSSQININITSMKKPYDKIVMGGTFDRLHYGHKVLLSEAIMLANDKITCGVTVGEMNKRKILSELIEPVDFRCKAVINFVEDVSESIKCLAVPIYDTYGPSIVDNDIQAIVVSEETLKGGEAVNEKRKEKVLNHLNVHVIKLLECEILQDNILNEVKISSSAQRRQILGTLLRKPTYENMPISKTHYVIGLTGGIASGKTHISKYLESQGCEIVECDSLVHKLYVESEELRTKLAKEFGESILLDNGRDIDRKKLSDLVFKDKIKLKNLNEIVWPLAAKKVAEIVRKSTKEIIVVDAALLLEAGWDKFLQEVWTVFVPREEAVKRVSARDSIPIEQASERIDHQLGNEDRIARSNVVFCSLWDYSETERQVRKALERVKKYNIPELLSK